MVRCVYNNWFNGFGMVGGVIGYLNMFVLGYEVMIMVLSVFLFLGGVVCGGVLVC